MKPAYHLSLFGPAPLAVLSALVLAHATAQTSPSTLVLTETNNGSMVGAVLQQPISVHLRGNASTPYSWDFIDANGTSVVTNGPSDYVPDSPGLPGSPGTFEFPFLAVQAGATTLNFVEHLYGNPQDVLATFDVTINVTNAQPILSIALVGNEVLISWPNTTSKDFFLEGTSLLSGNWAALNALVQDDGQNYWVRLGRSGPPLFFRLHRL
jgi:predicted secreted protein